MISKDQIREHIRDLTPFDCDVWENLALAIQEEYHPHWGVSLDYALNGLLNILHTHKNSKGSWNIPLKICNYDRELPVYKVFTKTSDPMQSVPIQLKYEFHAATVPTNQWISPEISGSAGLSGLSKETGGKFHTLLDKTQAEVYLNKRTAVGMFENCTPVIMEVLARKFLTIDLIYVPPISFVWGMDAKEMFVKYE